MSQILLIIFSLLSFNVFATEFDIKTSSPSKIKYQNAFPIQLIHADDNYIIYNKGNASGLTKEVEFFNKDFKSLKKIPLTTKSGDRADYFIWTGEQLITLWEKKVKNNRSLAFQLTGINGRASSKSNLGVLENCFSPYLRDHQVETISSPNQEYFAFIVKDVYSKSYSGKNADYYEFIAVFDKKGKLLEKQKNTFNEFTKMDGFHFLTDEGDLLKVVSNSSKNELLVTKKNLSEKKNENFKITLDFPKPAKPVTYHIIFNNNSKTYDYIATTKSHDTIIGQNGIFIAKFDFNEQVEKSNWYSPFADTLLLQFRNISNFSEGNSLFKDLSLSSDFRTRKIVAKDDGGFYVIQEYYNSFRPEFLKGNTKQETSSKIENRFNTDYRLNTSYNTLDLIVTHVNPSGKVEWIQRIPKSQNGLGYQYGSFDAFSSDDNLYILYNREKNESSFVKKMDSDHVPISNIVPLGRKIDAEGNLSFFDLTKKLEGKMIFYPLFSISGNAEKNNFVSFIQQNTSATPCDGKLIRIQVKEE